MTLVTRNHLENWAKRIDSKGDLPYLISRLVRATTPASTQVDFPSGSAAYVGGWDGVVTCWKKKLMFQKELLYGNLGQRWIIKEKQMMITKKEKLTL